MGNTTIDELVKWRFYNVKSRACQFSGKLITESDYSDNMALIHCLGFEEVKKINNRKNG